MTRPARKTPTQETAPPDPEQPVNEYGDAVASLDDDALMFVTKVASIFDKHNAVVNQMKGHSTNLLDVKEAVKSDNTDPKVKDWNDQIAEVQAMFDRLDRDLSDYATEVATQRIAGVKDDKEIMALEETRKKGLASCKNLRALVASEYGDQGVKMLPDITSLSSGSGKEGVRRLRSFSVWVDGKLATLPVTKKDGTKNKVSSFNAAASVIGVETTSLQDKYIEFAKTDKSDEFPVGVAFEWDVDKGDTTYHVKAQKNSD